MAPNAPRRPDRVGQLACSPHIRDTAQGGLLHLDHPAGLCRFGSETKKAAAFQKLTVQTQLSILMAQAFQLSAFIGIEHRASIELCPAD
jgi:hypothetical protein